jgi:tetratricopeptide (TPR) repeat protein
MQLPLRLRRAPTAHAAIAAYIPGRDASAILDLCARRGLDVEGRVFDLSGGFLVVLDAPTRAPIPGAIRLRALTEDLYLPADAELTPALLDDESGGLARDRGLVFLPGGRALAFDPGAPLEPSRLLSSSPIQARDWRPLPRHAQLASRIEEIVLDRPEDTAESIFDNPGDGDPIGDELPTPEDVGPASTLLGKASLSVGKGVTWLGKALHSSKLAALGANFIERAGRLTPRLTEDLLGRQSAALRNLLKEFREGNVERALRRALPLGEPGDTRGATPYAGDQLPERPFAYGLDDLLSGPQRGGGSHVWMGSGDVMAELTREYRKAAEEALRRGDYRRAAAIHGKLLRDYRAAAQALIRGGLHHDAAVLLLNKLDDRRAAAREFEAAGDFDRAVQLFRQVNDHESAADLLHKIGEDELALAEYTIAANQLCINTTGYLAAGRLMLDKARRPDLALERFQAGWARRPGPNVATCAIESIKIHADLEDVPAIMTILDQADVYFVSSESSAVAGIFFNGIATIANRPGLASARETLRDRALLALAAQMRRHALPGQSATGVAAALLSLPATWPAPLVSDGSFALAAATRASVADRSRDASDADRAGRRVRVGTGVVSAATAAPHSGTVFVGFIQGEVHAFQPDRSEVMDVSTYHLPVASLATDDDGQHLVVLRANESGRGVLSSYARQPDGSFRLLHGKSVSLVGEPWLTPICLGMDESFLEPIVGLWDGECLNLLMANTLNTWRTIDTAGTPSHFRTALLLEDQDEGDLGILANTGFDWGLHDTKGVFSHDIGLRWKPARPAQSTLQTIPLSHRTRPGGMRVLAGLGESGSLHWAVLDNLNVVALYAAPDSEGTLAVAIVDDRLVAGINRAGIVWYRSQGGKLVRWRVTDHQIPAAVAAFTCLKTGELIVVRKDGLIERISIPTG